MLQNKNSCRPNKIEACYRVENQQHEDCTSLTSICKVFNLRTKGDDLIKGCLVTSIVAKIKGQHKNLKSQCFNINMIDGWSRNKLFFSISTPDSSTCLALPPLAIHWSLTFSRSSPLLKYSILKSEIHFGRETLQWSQLWLHFWRLPWQELLQSPYLRRSPKQPEFSFRLRPT